MLTMVCSTVLMIMPAARAPRDEPVAAVLDDDGGRHRAEHAVCLDAIALARPSRGRRCSAVPGLRREIVHLVVQQEAGAGHGLPLPYPPLIVVVTATALPSASTTE